MQVLPVGQFFPLQQPAGKAEKEAAGGASFAAVLQDAVNKLNEAQQRADGMAIGFLTGDVQDLHQVTVAMEEARLSMQLAVEVRNKVIEAYQEISRMQI